MAYVALNEHRIPYDIDGTEVGYNSLGVLSNTTIDDLLLQFPAWMSSLQKGHFNSETRQSTIFNNDNIGKAGLFFFFPEQVEVAGMTVLFHLISHPTFSQSLDTLKIYGSDDSTNGLDGTWESAVFVTPTLSEREDYWRESYIDISFSKPVRVVKIGFNAGNNRIIGVAAVHLFGQKASGQTPDDIVFTDSAGTPLTKLVDFGDTPEGTTSYQQIRVKNASATKNANNINLQLNHADFDFSYSPTGPWLSVIDISSLGPGSLSQVIYLRHHLEPPLLPLGPKAARIIAAVGSWT